MAGEGRAQLTERAKRQLGRQAKRRLLRYGEEAVLAGAAPEEAAGCGCLLALLVAGAGAVLAVAVVFVLLLSGSTVQNPDSCQQQDAQSGEQIFAAAPGNLGSPSSVSGIPDNYLRTYQAAGEEYGLDWTILAGIGRVETNHGQLDAPGVKSGENFAGAGGPMQFLASTWASEGVDGNGDGVKDRYDYEDAIPGAANYLRDSGAPQDYHSAILAYNHAEWYYDDVMRYADQYRQAAESGGGSPSPDDGSAQPALLLGDSLSALPAKTMDFLVPPAYAQEAPNGNAASSPASGGAPDEAAGGEAGSEAGQEAVFPLPRQYMDSYDDTWGAARPGSRSHQGTDLMADEGTPILSVTNGVVRETGGSSASHYSEVGGYNIMVEATEAVGPVQEGDLLYYAHMKPPGPSVEPGQEVSAGDQIGSVGSTGYGPEVTEREFEPHLHFGWYDPSGARNQAPDGTGAMDPYPLLQWLKKNGGSASGEAASPSAAAPTYCQPSDTAGGVPATGTADTSGQAPPSQAPPPPGSSQQATGDAQTVLEAGREYMGVPYVLGGADFSGIDCSGLVMRAYEAVGVQLPHHDDKQMDYGTPVDQSELQPGDVVFFSEPGHPPDGPNGVTHVALYAGDGQLLHASDYFGKVVESDMAYVDGYLGARRLL